MKYELYNWEEKILRKIIYQEAKRQKLMILADRIIEQALKTIAQNLKTHKYNDDYETALAFIFSEDFDTWCDMRGLDSGTIRYCVKKLIGGKKNGK